MKLACLGNKRKTHSACLFSKEDSLFYDLERIWRDGKIVESVDEL